MNTTDEYFYIYTGFDSPVYQLSVIDGVMWDLNSYPFKTQYNWRMEQIKRPPEYLPGDLVFYRGSIDSVVGVMYCDNIYKYRIKGKVPGTADQMVRVCQ